MKFTEEHEWLVVEDDHVIVGITEHAAEALGDESVKAASDITAPLDGEIIAVNDALVENPELVNQDAMGQAWFFKLKLADPGSMDELMDEDAYKELIG